MNWKTKKISIVAMASIALLLVVGIPQSVQAVFQPAAPSFSLLSCTFKPFTCAIGGISWFVNSILGLFISLGMFLIREGLQFNSNIVNSPAVQSGFGVSLAVANLGFILAIIVIALATILRSQSYGIKQLLWKLVVAAVLVNFSLVIAGAILGFSDSLTNFFMDAATPGHNIVILSINPLIVTDTAYVDFVNKLTGAFAPQSFFQPPPSTQAELRAQCKGTYNLFLCAVEAAAPPGFGWLIKNPLGDLSDFVSMTLGLVLSAVFLLVINWTLFAIAVWLFIRYVYIGILLILAPLAWLLWIFPTTKSNFGKWWGHFIKWAFFPPIMIFFLYLALLTANDKTKYIQTTETPPSAASAKLEKDSPEASLLELTKNPNIVGEIGQEVIMIALAVGGLFAANSLSITGAGAAISVAKAAGGAVQGYAFKKGKIGVGAALQRSGLTERLQRGTVRGIPKRLQAMLGTAASGAIRGGGSDLVKQELKKVRELSPPERTNLLMNRAIKDQEAFALLQEKYDKEELGDIKTIKGKSPGEFLGDKRTFERWGQDKLYKDLNKAYLGQYDQDNRGHAEAIAADPNAMTTDTAGILGTRGANVRRQALLDDNQKKLAATITRKDTADMNLNARFSNESLADRATEVSTRSAVRGILSESPHTLSSFISNTTKAEPLNNFTNIARKQLNEMHDELAANTTMPREQQNAEADRIAEIENILNKSIANNALGFMAGGAAAAAPPAPPTTP